MRKLAHPGLGGLRMFPCVFVWLAADDVEIAPKAPIGLVN